MKRVVIDFETYYDKVTSVSVQGVPNYVNDPNFDAYMISAVAEDIKFCGSTDEFAKKFPGLLNDPQVEFWAANANFDQGVWEKLYGKAPNPWQCVLDRAAANQLPFNLDAVGKTVLGIELDKEVRDLMKGRRFQEMPPEEQDRVTQYCLDDSIATYKLMEKIPEPSAVEQKIAAHTRMTNRRGIHIDLDKVERDYQRLHRLRHQAFHQIPWADDGKPPLSPKAWAEYCRFHNVEPPPSLDKRDKRCDEWMKQNPELAKAIMAQRLFRGCNTKQKKIDALRARVTPEGILPMELLYCGARHTRRWSSKGFNVQNLDRDRSFVSEMEGWDDLDGEAGVYSREYLVPPPGKVFGILDFAQIEPRCLNWLAGNTELLDKIREGFGVYEAYARSVGLWSGPKALKEADPVLYHSVKAQVLGLGYGMGAARYAETAGVDESQAATTVHNWRNLNPGIAGKTGLWKTYEKTVRAAFCDSSKSFGITMPSGDLLCHYRLMGSRDGYYSYSCRGEYSQRTIIRSVWGGTVTENVTQRMARDIIAEAVVRLEEAGIPVIFHTHDEVITALDKETADKDLKEAERILVQPPEWCADVPLEVEGGLSPYYTKM